MKQKTMLLMVVAIVCGLAAAVMVSKLRSSPVGEREAVLSAVGDLPAGIKIDDIDKYFVPKEFLLGTKPLDAYDASEPARAAMREQIIGKKLMVPLAKGEVVTKKHLEDTSIMNKVLDGFRAVSVPVRNDTAGSGFITPGARVDLMTTYTKEGVGTISQTILQDIRVLAINDQKDKPAEGPGTMNNPTTATLEVKPEQALKLELAKSVGRQITLSLRPVGDKEIITDPKRLSTTSFSTTKDGGLPDDADKVLMAKRDIKQGEKIENIGDLFEEKEVPFKADEAIIKSLQDKALPDAKIVLLAMKKGTPIYRSFLGKDEKAPLPKDPVKAPEVFVQRIFIGGKEPILTTYWDGKTVGSTGPEKAPPGAEGTPKTGSEGK